MLFSPVNFSPGYPCFSACDRSSVTYPGRGWNYEDALSAMMVANMLFR